MDRAAKLDSICDWLVEDCKCDLVAVDEKSEVIELECWTADHRAFRIEWPVEDFDRREPDVLSQHVHHAFRRARTLRIPEWAL